MSVHHGGRGPGHMSRWTAAVSPIPGLFASGEQGAWLDLTDTSTWYQDAARTTPAATLGDVVGGIADKSGRGNHASQATTAQKPLRARIPLGGRRNMLTYTNWTGGTAGTLGAGAVAPTSWAFLFGTGAVSYPAALNGGGTAVRFSGTAQRPVLYFNYTLVAGVTYAQSIYIDAIDSGTFQLQGAMGISAVPSGTATYYVDGVLANATDTAVAGTRLSIIYTIGGTGGAINLRFGLGINGAATGDITLSAPQFETRSATTAYQKVVADWDVTESGVTSIPALYFDGSDDSLATAAVDFATCTSDGAARRNLLTFPSVFTDAVWQASNATVTANAVVAPDGTTTADKFIAAATTSSHYLRRDITSGVTAVYSVYAKAAEETSFAIGNATGSEAVIFNLANGTLSGFGAANGTITSVGDGWYRCSYYRSSWTDWQYISLRGNLTSYLGDGTSGLYLWGAQFELGSTATAFQDIGTDKMTVFAGVEKLSDAAIGMVMELSPTISANNGAFWLGAPIGAGVADYDFASKGTVGQSKNRNGFTAPHTAVLTGQANISGPSVALSVNGSTSSATTASQGTGNYGNHALFIGRRNSASLPFKGYMIGHLVIVGKTANASEIAAVEATERAATGAY